MCEMSLQVSVKNTFLDEDEEKETTYFIRFLYEVLRQKMSVSQLFYLFFLCRNSFVVKDWKGNIQVKEFIHRSFRVVKNFFKPL